MDRKVASVICKAAVSLKTFYGLDERLVVRAAFFCGLMRFEEQLGVDGQERYVGASGYVRGFVAVFLAHAWC